MKRWIPAVLVLAGLVVLLSPGIVGHLAERQIEQQIEMAAERDPLLAIVTENFTRGWFMSEGRHRVPLANTGLRRIVLAAAGADTATRGDLFLVVDTRIDHGLLPLSAVSREASAALPALASGVSTMALELPGGERVPLPGNVASRIALDGSAQLRYRLEDGSAHVDGTSIAWNAADVAVFSSADGRRVGGEADLSGWAIGAGNERVSFGRLQSDSELRAGPHGLLLGDLAATISDARIPLPDGRTLSWSALDWELTSGAEGDRVSGAFMLSVADLDDEETRYNVSVVARAGELDAKALRPLLFLLQNRNTGSAWADDGGTDPFDAATRTLLSAGATIDLDQFLIATPFGDIRATFSGELPAQDRLASWPSLALGMRGALDIALPVALLDKFPEFREQVPMLLGTGFVIREGDTLRMRASYENGMATVNGAPVPVGGMLQ